MRLTLHDEMLTNTDIRKVLTEGIGMLRAKKVGHSYLNAISNATGKYLSSVKLELEVCKLLGIKPGTDFFGLPPKKPTKH